MIFNNPKQLNQVSPLGGRLMALDLGTKRIGVALSDESRLIASPKLILNRKSNERDFSEIKKFIEDNKVVGVVIGLPLQMDGSSQPMTEFAHNFAENLDEFLEKKLPIFLFEERLTSFEARSFNNSPLSRKKNKFYDDIAASVILQHFLDS
jgi:putative Holliday junction resolvase